MSFTDVNFTNRKKIEELYYEWINGKCIADKPSSVVAFMLYQGWLNEEKIGEDLRKGK